MDRAILRQILTTYFSKSELRDLYFDLGVDYEASPDQGRDAKAIELIAYFERRGRAAELVTKLRQVRPHAFEEIQNTESVTPARASPPTAGISPDFKARLQKTLTRCGPFANDVELKLLFIDERICPWRDQLPAADTVAKRIDTLINTLYDAYSATQENALVLFLQVLKDDTNAGTACYQQLDDLARELERIVKNTRQSHVFDKLKQGHLAAL